MFTRDREATGSVGDFSLHLIVPSFLLFLLFMKYHRLIVLRLDGCLLRNVTE